ncbi:MAG: hypothetical protein WCF85_04845 [Rhodospirillaceae bacterium]
MSKGKVTAAALLGALLLLGAPSMVLAQAQGSGGTGNNDSGTTVAAADSGGMSDGEKAAVGCGVGGSIAMLTTYIAGPTEITLLWGGGMLFPTNSALLALSLLGQMGASGCAIGAVATPTVLWAVDQSDNIVNKMFQVSDRTGRKVMEAFGVSKTEASRQVAEVSRGGAQ